MLINKTKKEATAGKVNLLVCSYCFNFSQIPHSLKSLILLQIGVNQCIFSFHLIYSAFIGVMSFELGNRSDQFYLLFV